LSQLIEPKINAFTYTNGSIKRKGKVRILNILEEIPLFQKATNSKALSGTQNKEARYQQPIKPSITNSSPWSPSTTFTVRKPSHAVHQPFSFFSSHRKTETHHFPLIALISLSVQNTVSQSSFCLFLYFKNILKNFEFFIFFLASNSIFFW
jgi:hypothetical protein